MACAVALIPTAGCGASGGSGGGGASSSAALDAQPAPPSAALAAAERPRAADFPAVGGRTLRQLAGTVSAGPQLGLATTLYTPGVNRLGFGMIASDGSFLYAPAAVYVARSPDAPARGPFLAPADSLQVRAPFRNRTSASDPADVRAVYHADVPLPKTGRWWVLAVLDQRGQVSGATSAVAVHRTSPVLAVGDPAPRIETPTLASVGGKVSEIDTRDPPDDMHKVSLKDVLGKRPVALLFATPALCQSRVCGPVTDVAAQLERAYGSRVAFIHNEIYVDNNPSKGLRPQLKAFGVTTEPWLFAIDRRGRIVARLEGAFGFEEMKRAVEAAIRR